VQADFTAENKDISEQNQNVNFSELGSAGLKSGSSKTCRAPRDAKRRRKIAAKQT
jgi:hypothetical protein